MAVEVKDGNDWLSNEQRAVLIDLNAHGIPTYIWTPVEKLMAYPPTIHQPEPLEVYQLQQRIADLERENSELGTAFSVTRQRLTHIDTKIVKMKKEWRDEARAYRELLSTLMDHVEKAGISKPANWGVLEQVLRTHRGFVRRAA
jgi:hypothetical protein